MSYVDNNGEPLRMQILIPLADGHELPMELIKSVAMQTIDCDIITISRPIDEKNRRTSEIECRNILRKYATRNYVIYMDSDAIFTSVNDVKDAIDFMDKHHDIVQVS